MLAARAALRALPFAQMGKCEDYRGGLALPLFCAGAVSWSAAKYPAFETNLAARAAATLSATFSNPAMAARLRPFFSPEIFVCHRLTNVSEDAARAAILSALSGKHGGDAAIQRDAAAKASGKLVPDILARKLWPGARPRWIAELWKELKQDLLAAKEDWDVWTDWYEARLRGKAYNDESETARLRIAEEYWEQGPGIVNREIRSIIVTQVPNRRREKRRAPSSMPGVPALRPAALEPAWSRGKLIMLPDLAKSDYEPVVLVISLKFLRDEIGDLVAAAVLDPKIDQRSISVLRSVAQRIPICAPAQDELFYLAHLKDFLEAYVNNANGQWPAFFAERFAAVTDHLDRMIQRFPKWRDFVSNAENDPLTSEEAAEIPALADLMVAALRENEVQNLIDPAIPSALQVFQAPLLFEAPSQSESMGQGEQIARPGEASKRLLANDLFVSIDNIAKRTAEAALGIKNSGKPNTETGFASEEFSLAEENGRQAFIWMTRTLLKIMTSTPTPALHARFCWLKPVLCLIDPQEIPINGTAAPSPGKS
jgi:hypothetical protein